MTYTRVRKHYPGIALMIPALDSRGRGDQDPFLARPVYEMYARGRAGIIARRWRHRKMIYGMVARGGGDGSVEGKLR